MDTYLLRIDPLSDNRDNPSGSAQFWAVEYCWDSAPGRFRPSGETAEGQAGRPSPGTTGKNAAIPENHHVLLLLLVLLSVVVVSMALRRLDRQFKAAR